MSSRGDRAGRLWAMNRRTDHLVQEMVRHTDLLLDALNQAVGLAIRSEPRAQTATQVIKAAFTCDLRLQDIVASVQEELRVDGVFIIILDKEKAHVITLSGWEEEAAAILDDTNALPVEDSYCKIAVGVQDSFVVDDAMTEPLLQGNPHVEQVRGYLGEVLIVRQERVGSLCAISGTPRAWDDEEQRLVQKSAKEVSSILELALARFLTAP